MSIEWTLTRTALILGLQPQEIESYLVALNSTFN